MLYSELDSYFKLRFKELIDKRTPDSYRVRNHNALSILSELCELIEGWQKRRIQMYETVSLCIEECISLLEKDLCLNFSFYNKDLFIANLKEYDKALPESKDKRESIFELSSNVKYAARKCIHDNTPTYISSLFSLIQNEIAKPGDMDADGVYVKTMQKFDWAVSTLCTELLRVGYSKNHLFLKAELLMKGSQNINSLVSDFVSPRKSDYSIVFKFTATDDVVACKDDYGFIDNVDDVKALLQKPNGVIPFNSFLSSSNGILFYKTQVQAFDTYAAIKKAKGNLDLLLDELHLGIAVKDVALDPKVVVFFPAAIGYYSYQRYHDYQLDGEYENDYAMSIRLKNDVDRILGNPYVKSDVKERLKSALRHLRMANDCSDIELRFINLWVALEFIFSSPISNENTFLRIKKHLVNVLCFSYIKRNVTYLDKLLHECGALADGQDLYSMNDAQWGSLINGVTDSRAQYRLCCMKSNLCASDKIKDYVKLHETNLQQHLSRIYRMRNVLIHEAAIRQDIEGATSNLRFYLIFLLNQMLSFFSKADDKMNLSINDFFHEYENGVKVIKAGTDRNFVLKVNYESNLIR